ncbi:helix-turn-helix domain-containing protein [Anoxybacterium hadale]|uniref:Helix-turn-helix domain-containing protein n=1 Tax=Anoxybacterium hadale TaxID=3408580 RepID=A0ACD1A683_9FIRM|nr:helix-turn-helix domain-containing protein [Clostridiales bacterium]
MLSSYERAMLEALYDSNRIPLWIFDSERNLINCFVSGFSADHKELLASYVGSLLGYVKRPQLDIMCYGQELYYVFALERQHKTFYLFGGPMLLSGFYHVMEMRTLSFAEKLSAKDLESIVDHLPVVSLAFFRASLRILMLLLNGQVSDVDEISSFPFSTLQVDGTFFHELSENLQDLQLHTPYRHELAVLDCVKEGNVKKLEFIYRTLPQIKYGNMSNYHSPMKQLFYGSIANTTLITRYAIEGGLEEEAAFTLSDVYIKQMEKCRTLYELNRLNEKMAVDFTERVAKLQTLKKPEYPNVIARCIDFISKNIHRKITLEMLAREIHLTPKYISSLFRAETGQTITSFIAQQKIETAQNLLVYSKDSFTEISNSLSYYSQSHFISVFKRNVGMTPKEYRRRYSKG